MRHIAAFDALTQRASCLRVARSTTTTGRTHRWATEPHGPTLRSVPT